MLIRPHDIAKLTGSLCKNFNSATLHSILNLSPSLSSCWIILLLQWLILSRPESLSVTVFIFRSFIGLFPSVSIVSVLHPFNTRKNTIAKINSLVGDSYLWHFSTGFDWRISPFFKWAPLSPFLHAVTFWMDANHCDFCLVQDWGVSSHANVWKLWYELHSNYLEKALSFWVLLFGLVRQDQHYV